MTSQSVMVSFVSLPEAAGSAGCGDLFAMYRKRVGRSSGGTISTIRLHNMTALVVPRHQRTLPRARQTAHKHTALDGTPRHFARVAL